MIRWLAKLAARRLGGVELLDTKELERAKKALSEAAARLDSSNPSHALVLTQLFITSDTLRRLESAGETLNENIPLVLLAANIQQKGKPCPHSPS